MVGASAEVSLLVFLQTAVLTLDIPQLLMIFQRNATINTAYGEVDVRKLCYGEVYGWQVHISYFSLMDTMDHSLKAVRDSRSTFLCVSEDDQNHATELILSST